MFQYIDGTIREFDQITNDAKVRFGYQPHETVRADVDSNRLCQVVRNLLGNAVKFSPPGGTVRVTVSKDLSGDNVQVSVTDQGPGIPEDEKELIFEKFTQSRRTNTGAGGTGLGLAISREIVAAHSDSYSFWCSNTIRTARSRISREYLFDLFITPSSQEMEPPTNPGRFITKGRVGVEADGPRLQKHFGMSKEELNEELRKLEEDPSYGIVNLGDLDLDELLKMDSTLMVKYVGSWEAWRKDQA